MDTNPEVRVYLNDEAKVVVDFGYPNVFNGQKHEHYDHLFESVETMDGEKPILKQFQFLLNCNGGSLVVAGQKYNIKVVQEPSIKKRSFSPASDGESDVQRTRMKYAPSSDDGQLVGLAHASVEHLTTMQCTSTPACARLLDLFAEAAREKFNSQDKFGQAAATLVEAAIAVNDIDFPHVHRNVRHFTGAMVDAMNTVLSHGYSALHQKCLGTGATHSVLSARRINYPNVPRTLMVGEGKWNSNNIRNDTRGQIFNQLLRHREIDAYTFKNYRHGNEQGKMGAPILLLAFDNRIAEIDVAFPSTKRGKLADEKVVAFQDEFPDAESFWTVRLVRLNIETLQNASILFRFIPKALALLDGWPQAGRVQFKLPYPLSVSDEENIDVDSIETIGPNVTVLTSNGKRNVYKEFCYHLREYDGIMAPELPIEKKDQRLPPPEELLHALGEPYTAWVRCNGPLGTCVLRYPYIENTAKRPTVGGWLMILGQIKRMHLAHFVHGDLLPRNVIFKGEEEGYVLDFDLSRKEGDRYVAGFNHRDFEGFRHKGAVANQPMKKEHDVHSLCQMSKEYFELEDFQMDTIDELIAFFKKDKGRIRSAFSFNSNK